MAARKHQQAARELAIARKHLATIEDPDSQVQDAVDRAIDAISYAQNCLLNKHGVASDSLSGAKPIFVAGES